MYRTHTIPITPESTPSDKTPSLLEVQDEEANLQDLSDSDDALSINEWKRKYEDRNKDKENVQEHDFLGVNTPSDVDPDRENGDGQDTDCKRDFKRSRSRACSRSRSPERVMENENENENANEK